MTTRTKVSNLDRDAYGIPSYPAPIQLSPPTDLSAHAVEVAVRAVNQIVADAFALYVKTKSYHWHVAGAHFREYHRLFDEQADHILGMVDVLAERVRCLGGATIRSITHISLLQTIPDDNETARTPREMIERLIEDNLHFVVELRTAHRICEQSGDSASTSVLEGYIAEAEQRKWFLFETLQSTGMEE
jgi:starvation-inducible DNA-binding protein